MNKKIKIIDLLNMQYKNEKMPKNIRIKYALNFDYYTYNEKMKWYETVDKTTILTVFRKLDYEVEILEDNTKEIEELKYDVVDENGRGWYKLDTIADKVNELVKYINKKEDKNGNKNRS